MHADQMDTIQRNGSQSCNTRRSHKMGKAKITVMVVDDTEDERNKWAELVRQAGFATLTPSGVHSAIEAAKTAQCILMDYDLGNWLQQPQMDGIDVSNAILKQHGQASPPIIFLTFHLGNPRLYDHLAKCGWGWGDKNV